MACRLVLYLFLWMTAFGTSYTAERCNRVSISRVRHYREPNEVVVQLSRAANDKGSGLLQNVCNGTINGQTFITWESCGEV